MQLLAQDRICEKAMFSVLSEDLIRDSKKWDFGEIVGLVKYFS